MLLSWDEFALNSDEYRFFQNGARCKFKKNIDGYNGVVAYKGWSAEIVAVFENASDDLTAYCELTDGQIIAVSQSDIEVEPDYDQMTIDNRHLWTSLCLKMTDFMSIVNPENYKWIVFGRNLTWRNLSGWKEFRAETGREFFSSLLPKTECSFIVNDLDEGKGFRVINSHHDAMNEIYDVYPKIFVVRYIGGEFIKEEGRDVMLSWGDKDDARRDIINDFESGDYEIVFYGNGELVEKVKVNVNDE